MCLYNDEVFQCKTQSLMVGTFLTAKSGSNSHFFIAVVVLVAFHQKDSRLFQMAPHAKSRRELFFPLPALRSLPFCLITFDIIKETSGCCLGPERSEPHIFYSNLQGIVSVFESPKCSKASARSWSL